MVKVDYEELMRSKSDDGLRVYIDYSAKYQPEAVNAAIQELALRGNPIQEETVIEIRQIEEKAAEKVNNAPLSFPYKQEHLVVDDETAPLLYSRSAVFISSVFLGGIFGSIIMAINIKRNNYRGLIPIIIFGMLYTITLGTLSLYGPKMIIVLTIPFSILGGIILTNYFWPKYIGKETMFRLRPIWTPVMIWIFITAIITISSMATNNS